MKTTTKVFCALALVALLIGVALAWLVWRNILFPPLHKFSAVELRQILVKGPGEQQIQAEVDGLFSRFGENSKFLYDRDLVSAPELVQYAKTLDNAAAALDNAAAAFHNETIDIEANGFGGLGVPCHVQLRFGPHLGVQFILIFRTGADLSALGSDYEKIAHNIYLRIDGVSQR